MQLRGNHAFTRDRRDATAGIRAVMHAHPEVRHALALASDEGGVREVAGLAARDRNRGPVDPRVVRRVARRRRRRAQRPGAGRFGEIRVRRRLRAVKGSRLEDDERRAIIRPKSATVRKSTITIGATSPNSARDWPRWSGGSGASAARQAPPRTASPRHRPPADAESTRTPLQTTLP